jgi:putative Holliday junction resolvase
VNNSKEDVLIALDIGQQRTGVALADSIGRLAAPLITLKMDGAEVVRLQHVLLQYGATKLVVGLPRNQSGEETAQSKWVRDYVKLQLEAFGLPIVFQDESVTSVLAEEQLSKRKKGYTKADVDALAAALILQDYLDNLA